MTKTKENKPTRKDLDTKVMDGVDAHLANANALMIDGESFTPATLKAVFQADIDAMGKTDATRAELKAEVQAAKAARVRAADARACAQAGQVARSGAAGQRPARGHIRAGVGLLGFACCGLTDRGRTTSSSPR